MRQRATILAEINALRSMQSEGTAAIKVSGNAGDPIDRNSTIEKKVALFRGLFRGRFDVFPIRWENRRLPFFRCGDLSCLHWRITLRSGNRDHSPVAA